MEYASVTDRLTTLGGHKWEVHELARQMAAEGCDILELTVGEPDVAVMPGNSFGVTLEDWVRVALTVDDEIFLQACDRIIAHEKSRQEVIV